MSEELDRELRSFLREQKEDRDRGFTLERVHASVMNLDDALMKHIAEDHRRFSSVDDAHRSHRLRLEAVETSLSKVEEKVRDLKNDMRDEIREVKTEFKDEITGSHHIPPGTVVAVTKHSESRHSDSRFLREVSRGALKYLVWAAMVVAGGGVGALVHACFTPK